jgi:hypothetical protein
VGGKADHLAQQIGIWGLLYERAQVHHVVGHRWFLESGWCRNPNLADESSVTTRKAARSLRRYVGARVASDFANQIHHPMGHDRCFSGGVRRAG